MGLRGGAGIKELAELLLEQAGPDGVVVELEEFLPAGHLECADVLAPLEQQPAGVLQDGLLGLGLEPASLAGTELVDGRAELLHAMEAIHNASNL